MRHVKISVGLIATVCTFGILAAPALAADFEANKGTQTFTEGPFQSFNTKTEALKQVFTIGPIKYIPEGSTEPVEAEYSIKCENATGTGTASGTPSETLTVDVKYKDCFTSGKAPDKTNAAKFVPQEESAENPKKAPAVFVYNADGAVEIPEAITVKLQESKCTVVIDSQTLEPEPSEGEPSAKPYAPVLYSNDEIKRADKTKAEKEEFPEPEDLQYKLLITNQMTTRKTEEKETVGLEYEVEPTQVKEVPTKKGECAKIPPADRSGTNGTYTGNLHLELKNGSLKIS
jgi:hypothetical protein